MVDTTHCTDANELIDELVDCEVNTLDEAGIRDLYDIWSAETSGLTDNDKLIAVEEWLSLEKLDRRRPYLIGTVEYDDESKGAILFANLRTVDVSILENNILDEFLELDEYTIDDVLEPVDVTADNDYIDDPGMLWMPRSQITVFTQ